MPKPIPRIISDIKDLDTYTDVTILNTSPSTPFSFTLRKVANADKSDKKDYMYKLDKIKAMGIQVTDYCFENNKVNNGIHCHGVMQIPKKFNMKKFRSRGWHIQLDEIYDYAGWLSYITKESQLQSPILSDNESDPIEPQLTIPKKSLFPPNKTRRGPA